MVDTLPSTRSLPMTTFAAHAFDLALFAMLAAVPASVVIRVVSQVAEFLRPEA